MEKLSPYEQYITEIKISPEKVFYNISKRKSSLYDKYDYLINFETSNENYIILLLYFMVDDIETYNISFTTKKQFNLYNNFIQSKGDNLTNDDIITAIQIFERTTNLNEIYDVMKNISYVLFEFKSEYNITIPFSIMKGEDERKINLYKNIINDSFKNLTDKEVLFNNQFYYLYY